MKDKVVKFNKNAYFILPMIGLNTTSYGKMSFVNSYITMDYRIILKLIVPEYTKPLAEEYLLDAWLNGGHSMVSYAIPEKFHKDFDAFLEGRYSDYSPEAFDAVSESIETEIINVKTEDLTSETFKEYSDKMHKALHPVKYHLVAKQIVALTPSYLGAIAPKNHPLRETLRVSLANDLGLSLDKELTEDAELYPKPDLDKELLTEKMAINEREIN